MRTPRMFSLSRKLVVLACLALVAPTVAAHDNDDDDDHDVRASAVFGRGLNTAQPGNVVNDVVLPQVIKIKVGGVVDFSVAGFHDIIIFKPGFKYQDLIDASGVGELPLYPPAFVLPPDPTEPLPPELQFLAEKIYYRGIEPAGGPFQTDVQGNPANGSNRGEVVAFLEKGTYLVICNIRPHLLSGMRARVKVK